MDFFTKQQLISLSVFMVGIFILNWCTKLERRDQAEMRDPKNKWAYIDGEKEGDRKQKQLRGTLLTIIGVSAAMYGFITFLQGIPS